MPIGGRALDLFPDLRERSGPPIPVARGASQSEDPIGAPRAGKLMETRAMHDIFPRSRGDRKRQLQAGPGTRGAKAGVA
ncbi:hypothetical protein LCM08_12500 [Salipiger pacificus]|nr:hypothetical protein [Alloyangia pacifica]MCA0945731.1 hypothetical protein [Alloyangia pacifica]